MFKSVDELRPVMEKALKEVGERDTTYGDYWLREDREFLYQNIFRKSEGIRFLCRNGSINTPKGMEQLLDMIAYSAMVYRRLEIEDK